jgi:hypothetical protein
MASATIEPMGIQAKLDIWLTHHSPTCPVVEFPHLGASTALERVHCRCGAFEGHYSREHRTGSNIVTDAGDTFYAQQLTNGAYTTATPTVATVTNDFSTLELSADAGANPAPGKSNHRGSLNSVISGSQKAATSGYPRISDPDTDNSSAGTDVFTWSFTYSAGDFNDTDISDGIITNTSPGASEPVLNHFDENVWSPSGVFDKTANDTLKFIVNHIFTGA